MARPIRILLVEDDLELRRLYELRLTTEGFEVVVATDGEEAVVKALATEPDFIILDLMLPKQGGIHVARILKSNPLSKDIPILILTAYDNYDYRKNTHPLVVDYVLKTETTPQKIVEIVKAYLAIQ